VREVLGGARRLAVTRANGWLTDDFMTG